MRKQQRRSSESSFRVSATAAAGMIERISRIVLSFFGLVCSFSVPWIERSGRGLDDVAPSVGERRVLHREREPAIEQRVVYAMRSGVGAETFAASQCRD